MGQAGSDLVRSIFDAIDDDKRSKRSENHTQREVGAHNVLWFVNSTDLQGRDLKRLHHISTQCHGPDNFTFHRDDVEIQGKLSLQDGDAGNGLILGDLSLEIPGLDTPVEVNETAADEQTKGDFDKVFSIVLKQQSDPNATSENKIEDVIAKIADTISKLTAIAAI